MILPHALQVGEAILDPGDRTERATSLDMESLSSSRPLSSLERRTILEKSVVAFFNDGLLEDVEEDDEGRGTLSLLVFVRESLTSKV
jgi:NurA-like 5'-3' nuclease